MKMELDELLPKTTSIELSGKIYEMNPFTLSSQIWVERTFGTIDKSGLKHLEEAFRGLDCQAMAKLGYYLLKDKTDFPTLENFIDKFGNEFNIIKILLPSLAKNVIDNQPVQKNDEAAEIKKLHAASH